MRTGQRVTVNLGRNFQPDGIIIGTATVDTKEWGFVFYYIVKLDYVLYYTDNGLYSIDTIPVQKENVYPIQ